MSAVGCSSTSEASTGTSKKGCPVIPRNVLDQLTKVLWMDPSINMADPDPCWLDQQKAEVKGLDERLKLPKGVIKQFAARFDSHYHPAKFAHLCPAHSSLNPRVVRRIMLLIASEFTKRTDRFRTWRGRIPFPECVEAWMSRVDAATGLWIGREAFFAVFGYNQPDMDVQTVNSKCEACILAVVGGRPQVLTDLRASMFVREGDYPNHDHVEPRLWHIVESWSAQFDDDVLTGILTASKILAEQITKLKEKIDIKRGKRTKTSKKRSHSRHPVRKSSRNTVLPTPRHVSTSQDSCTSGSLQRHSNEYDKPKTWLSMDRPRTPTAMDVWEDDVNETDNETWMWMSRQMLSRGLTPRQSRDVLRDVHPALSDYVSAGELPSPLTEEEAPSTEDNMLDSMKDEARSRRSSWATMTVHSDDEGENELVSYNASQSRPMSIIPESDSTLLKMKEEETRALEEIVHDDESYVPARRDWDKAKLPHAELSTPAPPASSVYSSHAGFRGSQDPSTVNVPSTRRPLNPYPPRTYSGRRRAKLPLASRLPRPTNIAVPPPSSVYSSHPGFRNGVDHESTVAWNPYSSSYGKEI